MPVARSAAPRKERSNMPWLDKSAIEILREYSWPGNVRELENVLQRALVLADGGIITAAEILIDNALHAVADAPDRTMIDAFRQSAARA